MLYSSFNKRRRRLAKVRPVNLTRDTGRELGTPTPGARCCPLLYDDENDYDDVGDGDINDEIDDDIDNDIYNL